VYRRSANQGISEAQYKHDDAGEGVSQDKAQAAQLFRQALHKKKERPSARAAQSQRLLCGARGRATGHGAGGAAVPADG
jgi:hypothetical protein